MICACNNTNQKTVNTTTDSTFRDEDKNVDYIIKNDSLKMIEKEKELLKKYK